jgi:hypothetical protein
MAVIFVGVGGSSSFTYRHAGTSVAMRTRSADDNEDSRRDRLVLDDHRDADRLRHRPVMGEDRGVATEADRRGHHDRRGARGFRRLGQLDRHGRPAVGGAHHDREPARGALHEHLRHTAPVALRQLVGLAHDPQDVEAVDAAPRLELDQRPDAGLVDLASGVERRGRDGDDAPELRRHDTPLPME